VALGSSRTYKIIWLWFLAITNLSFAMKDLSCSAPFKARKTIQMNFIYGSGKALPKRPGMKAASTFDAILLGERTATTRKDKTLDLVKIGDVLRFVRDKKGVEGEILVRVLEKYPPQQVGPERWAELEGYDPELVKTHWSSGKKFSEYQFQLVYEVLAYRLSDKDSWTTSDLPRHPALNVSKKKN
jgi:hypothetical protein